MKWPGGKYIVELDCISVDLVVIDLASLAPTNEGGCIGFHGEPKAIGRASSPFDARYNLLDGLL